MAKMLWLNWSGGGNLPPSLGIARELERRGHRVAFAGRPEMVARVQDAGFRAIELTRAYEQIDRYPHGPVAAMSCYLTSPAVAQQVRETIAQERPDALLIDAMFPAALDAASEFDVPSAVFVHHFFNRLRNEWRATGERLNGRRCEAGFEPLPPIEALWQRHDRVIVTALAQFDTAFEPQWPSVRHAGPVLESENCAVSIALPWDANDRTPIALVSFSSAPEQRSLEKLQRTLDALADLDVHVIATTAGTVDTQELTIPANAMVVPWAAHDPLLEKAALLVTHGGHGTLMRAIKNGVPAIVMPGLAHDQEPNGKMLQEWGGGIALPGDAQTDAIRSAARTILTTPSYKRTVERLSLLLQGSDGASSAADEIESLLHTNTHIGGSHAHTA